MLGHSHANASGLKRSTWRGKELVHRQRIVVQFRADVVAPPGDPHPLHGTHPRLALIRKHRTGKHIFRVPDDVDPVQLSHELAQLGHVEWVEPDQVSTVASAPNDPDFGQQWGLQSLNIQPLWGTTEGSESILIGIVDSGIQFDHPDLTNPARYIAGENYVTPGTPPADDFGHGTHVCGIAAAETNNQVGIAGTNWRSPVYVTKVFDHMGFANNSDIAAAIEATVDYAVQHTLKAVINLSGACGAADKTLETACQHVADHGMLLCVAAGNTGTEVQAPALYSAQFPAAVIAVGAIDQQNTVASFSCRGPQLTVVAPGVQIYSTYVGSTYKTLNGTSMATPYVTGFASLLWAVNPALTNQEIQAQMVKGTIKLGQAQFDPLWGHGRIAWADAASAAALHQSAVSSPPAGAPTSPASGGRATSAR